MLTPPPPCSYAIVAGVLTSRPDLATPLTAYLKERGMQCSCMTGRWFLEALYRLGHYTPEASAYALSLLTSTSYPSWGYMIAQGATITMEAWRPADKPNMDWAHPWCSAPAFIIPR